MDQQFEFPRRMADRDATEEQVIETPRLGEPIPAHSGRVGCARVFEYGREHEGTVYPEIRVIVFAAPQVDRTVIVTVTTQFGQWSSS